MRNHLKTVEFLTKLLESQFKIGPFKFGLDPLIGLIPGGGDLITAIISFYIVWIGVQMKLPTDKIIAMIWNVILDLLLGLIPVIGDITDFIFHANTKNLKIIKEFAPEEVIEGEVI